MRGTLLNTATVTAGASLGLAVGKFIPESMQDVALTGLGLVTVAIALRMAIQVKNPLVLAGAVALGGVLGSALGIHNGVISVGDLLKARFGIEGPFTEALLTSFVLFCVGPLTLLGCIQDGVEGKSEILSLKAMMDGIASLFLASALGAGVLVSAIAVLVFQGAITLAARPLQPLAKDENLLAETSASGGALLIGTALGLLKIRDVQIANYLPAIFLAPIFVLAGERFAAWRSARG
jgi:uncharacterized membrane protein YqgA involved in biofilm formation